MSRRSTRLEQSIKDIKKMVKEMAKENFTIRKAVIMMGNG